MMREDVLKFLRYRGSPMGEGRQVVSEALLEYAETEIVSLRTERDTRIAAEEARDAYKARAQRAEALLETAARRDGLRIEGGEG